MDNYLKKSFSERTMTFPEVDDSIEKSVIGYPKVIQKLVDGKIVHQVEFVIDDPSEDRGYRVNDFALENLLAAGVKLSEAKFNSGSLVTADQANEIFEKLPIVKSNEN